MQWMQWWSNECNDLGYDTIYSKWKTGEGQGAFCKCNLGNHWPRALKEAGEPSDHLETKTKECFRSMNKWSNWESAKSLYWWIRKSFIFSLYHIIYIKYQCYLYQISVYKTNSV